jgi:hypothetical protein
MIKEKNMDIDYKLFYDTVMKGGRFFDSGKSDKDLDPKEIEKGTKHELEHVDSKSPYAEMIARKTAIDHIVEIPNYYTELDKIIPYLVLKPKNINNKQSLI